MGMHNDMAHVHSGMEVSMQVCFVLTGYCFGMTQLTLPAPPGKVSEVALQADHGDQSFFDIFR